MTEKRSSERDDVRPTITVDLPSPLAAPRELGGAPEPAAVVFSNSSSEILKVSWHPSYLIQNGTPHGTGLTSIQETKISPGVDNEVFNKQSPAGTTAGTPIAKCYPSFFNIQAG